ncbi:MAG: hypothetical protein ACO3QC_05820, partial [Phycisphaerales bacterium]
RLVAQLGERDAPLLDTPLSFTIVRFRNNDGIPMPLPLVLHFADGTTQDAMVPAEAWRFTGGGEASRLFVTDREIVRVVLDPRRETADRDPSDNSYPQEIQKGSFEVRARDRGSNPMRDARNAEGRRATTTNAGALGQLVAKAVGAGRSAGSAVASADESMRVDGWSKPFIVLDGAPRDEAGIAQIVSGGPDGQIGGDDDVTFIVAVDGSVREQHRRR